VVLLGISGWWLAHVVGREAAWKVPSWARVSAEQIACAKRHQVAVAFENDLGMRFVLIPEGTFWMGSPEGEKGRYKGETRHRVTLTRPFYLGVTEVTNGQYRRWKRDHDSGSYKGQGLNGDAQPVVDVSWNDATGFARWSSGRDGRRTYRLPTEAEWEHACRAGTETRYSWGDGEKEGHLYANANDPVTKNVFGWSYDGWPSDDGHRVAAPVGSYRPNGWGVHDMHGNAWEWCSDRYGAYPKGSVTDPVGASSVSARVLRGGSWNNNPRNVRSANRNRNGTGERNPNNGFRVAAPLPSSSGR
jgi:formylglycine-generating enzyme required for sulfatase activity